MRIKSFIREREQNKKGTKWSYWTCCFRSRRRGKIFNMQSNENNKTRMNVITMCARVWERRIDSNDALYASQQRKLLKISHNQSTIRRIIFDEFNDFRLSLAAVRLTRSDCCWWFQIRIDEFHVVVDSVIVASKTRFRLNTQLFRAVHSHLHAFVCRCQRNESILILSNWL